MYIRERVAAAVLHDEAGIVTIFDGPARREAAEASGVLYQSVIAAPRDPIVPQETRCAIEYVTTPH
jgi:hypothetical protein